MVMIKIVYSSENTDLRIRELNMAQIVAQRMIKIFINS